MTWISILHNGISSMKWLNEVLALPYFRDLVNLEAIIHYTPQSRDHHGICNR